MADALDNRIILYSRMIAVCNDYTQHGELVQGCNTPEFFYTPSPSCALPSSSPAPWYLQMICLGVPVTEAHTSRSKEGGLGALISHQTATNFLYVQGLKIFWFSGILVSKIWQLESKESTLFLLQHLLFIDPSCKITRKCPVARDDFS